tara:strand:+ start:129 stop:896 length:768 start_codon:yes stop_codon:yes gene_type:complete
MAENQYDFPTEVLDLPSKGLLYPKGNPLSSGQIDIKYMTAKEEDILTSTNLLEKGLAIDRLLESIIANPKIKLDDILLGDKNAIMIGARVLGYGKDYEITITDPDTTLEVKSVVDLTAIKNRVIDYSLLEGGENKFSFTLPNSKRIIEFKLLTHKDEKVIESTENALAKVSPGGAQSKFTTRYKQQIISIDGDTTKTIINRFIDNEFLALDSREFRKHIKSITPNVDLSFEYESQIGDPHTVNIPIGVTFFWPDV